MPEILPEFNVPDCVCGILGDERMLWEKLKPLVKDKNAGGALILSSVNRRYATGFPSSAGFVAITPEKTVFITDFRYYGSACEAKKQGKINSEVTVVLQDKTLWETLAGLFEGCDNILIEENYVTVSEYERLSEKFAGKKLCNGASCAFEMLRAVKTDSELEKIVKAQAVTDKAFAHILSYISDNLGKGLTEKQVALELDYFMLSNGADGIAFDTIAVNAEKSAMPHGVPDNIPIKKGFLTMDFGARFDGYCSDMTRTVSIGKPTEKMRDVYDTVLNAQYKALEYISAGKTGKSIDGVAREYIASRGYDGCFGHSLGHSLGLEIHESPNFSPSNNSPIPEGAVISVEPGVYLDGEFGVRIEDIVSVKNGGYVNLTNSPKELIIL